MQFNFVSIQNYIGICNCVYSYINLRNKFSPTAQYLYEAQVSTRQFWQTGMKIVSKGRKSTNLISNLFGYTHI